jgi:DNA-directed RNA polymerase specialized sigma24 family protein
LAKIINIEDIELAKLCSNGDEKARHELYTKYAAFLFALCIRYVGDRELARDLMHDAMIKIFDTIGKYKPTGSLKSWCGRVTVNMVIDYLRKSKRMNLQPLECSFVILDTKAMQTSIWPTSSLAKVWTTTLTVTGQSSRS